MAQRLETAGNPPLFCSLKSETRFPLIVNWLCAGSRSRRAMIVALLNQKGGVGKTTLRAASRRRIGGKGKRATLIDADAAGLGSRLVATTRP